MVEAEEFHKRDLVDTTVAVSGKEAPMYLMRDKGKKLKYVICTYIRYMFGGIRWSQIE